MTPIEPMPVIPGTAPVIDYIEPFTASPGATVAIYDQAGGADFGDMGDDDRVQMFNGAWVDMPIVSWTTNKIEFTVDGWTFTPNAWAGVRVGKIYWQENNAAPGGNNNLVCDPGETCVQIPQASNAPAPGFFVRKHPVLTSLVPDSGTWNTGDITINAVAGSFFSQREDFGLLGGAPVNYGYSTYVELTASNDKYRVTEMTGDGWSVGLGAWSDTVMKIRLVQRTVGGQIVGNLLDVNTGNYVPLADLYKGNWQLQVITDYFIDDGAVAGQYMLKFPGPGPATGHLTGKMDTDTLLYREISDPLPWFATDTPFISYESPASVKKGGNLFAIYGINFGTTQDTSYVQAWTGPFCTGGPIAIAPNLIYQWSNTRIVLKSPGSVGQGCLQVVVPKVQLPGSITSNKSTLVKITN
jgi:hypothetical protein